MRALLVVALFAPSLAFAAPSSAWPVVMGDPLFDKAKSDARSLQPACIAELDKGGEGSGCNLFRLTALKAVDVAGMRNEWCVRQLNDRAKAVPAQCLQLANHDEVQETLAQVGWPAFETKARKLNPEHWARVDASRGQAQN